MPSRHEIKVHRSSFGVDFKEKQGWPSLVFVPDSKVIMKETKKCSQDQRKLFCEEDIHVSLIRTTLMDS